MNIKNKSALRLLRPSDLFLPLALLAASLLGRGEASLALFVACCATKLCALATADGLRAAFATQPSMKYVQGSALVALVCQLPGAGLAALLLYAIPGARPLLPLVPCGMLLNIEHVFYEYLCAVGDKNSATFSRCITAVLTLLGLLLCMPPRRGMVELNTLNPLCPLVTSGISVLVGLFLGLALGGERHPVPNAEVLRRAPVAMLQAALCPALTLAALALLWPAGFNAAPVFVGLALYEACRTPFRRSPLESRPMNRVLLVVGIASLLGFVLFKFALKTPFSDVIAMSSTALFVATLCAFGLYGSIERRN